MSLRLVTARWVIPIASPPIEEGGLVVDDDDGGATATIIAVGSRADLRRAHPGLQEWRAEGALCPALVNAHAHLELSALGDRVPGGDGVVAWTRRLTSRLGERGLDEEGARASAVRAAEEARSFGTGGIADVGNGTAGWVALGRARLPGVFFHELVGSRESRTGDALADAAQERAAVAPGDRPQGVPAVPAPHAPYSASPELLRRIFVAAARTGHPTTIHLAEDADEVLLLREGGGAWAAVLRAMGVDPEQRCPHLSPTAYLQQLGAFAAGAPPPLLVHMVHADADDRRRAQETGATVVLCARSNLHISGQLPDVPAFVAEGVRLALGTDSLASVTDLSLWQEIFTLSARFPELPPSVWLHAATSGGASALGLAQAGALTPGKRPGLLDVALPGDAAADPERLLVSQAAPRVRWIDGPARRLADQ